LRVGGKTVASHPSAKAKAGMSRWAEIVLYQFLEFTKDCYGADVHRREEVERYTKIAEFYDAFKTRDSARRDPEAGEVPTEATPYRMHIWAEDSL
jgi:hypothetical protein